jgi:D-tyrosyl-tRNA(Tyr) deacylase
MRVILQRVASAAVAIAGVERARIGAGLLILVGVGLGDRDEDARWLAGKVARLRIFPDDAGLMNRSVVERGGELLAISQFTLFASTARGNRPSWLEAASPAQAEPLYARFVGSLAEAARRPVLTGVFGADMRVELVNDGPVTIPIDSRRRE